jgi:hypothetical protein
MVVLLKFELKFGINFEFSSFSMYFVDYLIALVEVSKFELKSVSSNLLNSIALLCIAVII